MLLYKVELQLDHPFKNWLNSNQVMFSVNETLENVELIQLFGSHQLTNRFSKHHLSSQRIVKIARKWKVVIIFTGYKIDDGVE